MDPIGIHEKIHGNLQQSCPFDRSANFKIQSYKYFHANYIKLPVFTGHNRNPYLNDFGGDNSK